MNRIYKIVKNQVTGNSCVASELAKGNKRSLLSKALILSMAFTSSAAIAGQSLVYQGENIVSFDTYLGISQNVWEAGGPITYYGNVGSDTGDTNNSLTLDFTVAPSSVPSRYTGVFAKNASVVSNNTLLVENAELSSPSAHLFGSFTLNDAESVDITATNNKLIINNVDIGGSLLVGAYNFAANSSSYARNNEVQINGGTINGGTISGSENIGVYGSFSQGNKVNINDGTYGSSRLYLIGANADTRNMEYFGDQIIPEAVKAEAIANVVNINGGDYSAVNTLLSVRAAIASTQSLAEKQNINVANNVINLNLEDLSVGNAVELVGGYIQYNIKAEPIVNPITFQGNIIGNVININDVAINSPTLNVYGGIVSSMPVTDSNITGGGSVDIKVNNNIVNLVDNGNLDVSSGNFYGGQIDSMINVSDVEVTQDFISGNTLNLYKNSANGATSIVSAQNFENYHFHLGTDVVDGDVLLSSTNAIDLDYLAPTDGVTVKDVNVSIKEIAMGSSLKTGDSIILMDNVANPNASATYQTGLLSKGQAQQGLGSLYDITVKLDNTGTALEATIGEGQATEQSKALFEGKSAGLAFVNQGADLIVDQGIRQAVSSSSNELDSVAFGTIGGGKNRYKTGSHVDVKGISLMTGFAKTQNNLTLGGFIEAGWGNYDSHNSFNSLSVDGDGSTNYYGFGALARYALNDHAYLDGSVRVGRVKTDFNSGDFLSGAGSHLSANYDSRSTYYGAQVGAGYVLALSENQSVDFSANYLWTRQGSDDVVLATGDKLDFDSVDSHRVRVGGRYFYESGKAIQPYLGVAYEYEFSGKAKGSINGFDLNSVPALKGGTGVFELGTKKDLIAGTGFSLNLGIKGYVGTREGVEGILNVNYQF